MIINYSLVRLSIISLLVILLPLIQKQWLNLYLFDIANFTIYKSLYYLSGIICPIFVIINSLNKFTFYKFNNSKENRKFIITGKLLLLISSTILLILSILFFIYIFINLRMLLNLFFNDYKLLDYFLIDKQILTIGIISIFLLFKKLKLFLKKASLINFFIMSIIIWYSEISYKNLNAGVITDILKIENINFLNLILLLSIEIFYYLWSFISYSSYLSDWKVPMLYKKEVLSISNILFFYFLIFLYYSLLL